MRNRRLWAGLVGLAMMMVCAAMVLVTWGSFTWAREAGVGWRVLASDTVSAESEEELRFPITGPATFDLINQAGAIDITTGASDEIVVTVHRTAWGNTEAEAAERLAALEVTPRQQGNAVSLEVPERDETVVSILGATRGDTVNFTVQVPAETTVTTATGFGDVTVSGTTGPAEARTSAGAVTLRNINGRVTAQSDFGAVVVEDAAGDSVDASSSSGRVRLLRVTASGALSAKTDFGDVSIEESAGSSVTAETSSGAVTLTNVEVSGLALGRSDFGAVSFEGVQAGSYELQSSSGHVSVDGASGAVTASTDFGDVTLINAEAVTIDLRTSSGQVHFAGSLGDGPHVLESDFGSLSLSLPAGTQATLELSTDFGSIQSDLPVTVAGSLDDDHWQGTLNGGGASLTARTNSGSITLEQLP